MLTARATRLEWNFILSHVYKSTLLSVIVGENAFGQSCQYESLKKFSNI